MSWITRIAPEGAPAALKAIFDKIRARSASQQVAYLWQSWGSHPEGLEAAYMHYQVLVKDPAPLSAAQVELIALVVSATNGCAYCVAHHGPKLARLIGDDLAHAVAKDYRDANIAARDRVLLDAAVALTCEPSERKQEDIERMREYGFDDAAILKATEITAYYNFVNRVANGIGVTIEPRLEHWEFGAQK
jgi:uncharacterized peroxidase-related enzyme